MTNGKGSTGKPTKRTNAKTTGMLPFRAQHGGRRKGAGRKPTRQQAGVSHRQREALASRHPVHVTVKLRAGLPRLRRKEEHAALRAALTAGNHGPRNARGSFRLCHYTILNDHLHLVVEARDRTALARGLQGLLIRCARKLNKLWARRGSVFADRYHGRALRTPHEVRNALVYVLQNGRRHAATGRMVQVPQAIDVYSSAPWFDGWAEEITVRGIDTLAPPVRAAQTWLLGTGWRRHGRISVHELPASG